MILHSDKTRRRRSTHVSARPTWPDQPAPVPSRTLPANYLAQIAVDPVRFVNAVRAAFEVGASCCNPHAGVLLDLEQQLAAPTATGLPDPLAPAVLVLAQRIYGESRAHWDEATATFRRSYLQASRNDSPTDPSQSTREADAAVLRWHALLGLMHDRTESLHTWFTQQPSLFPTHSPSLQAVQRATAMVYTAARTPLQRSKFSTLTARDSYLPELDALTARTLAVEASEDMPSADAHTADVLWNGLFEWRLAASRWALSALAQRFLAYLLVRVGAEDAAPGQILRVWADDLAAWAQMDPRPVHAAFAGLDGGHSPAHELHRRWVALPDWRWVGVPDASSLVLRWFAAPPRRGQDYGRQWLEVTPHRETWPYLRRLYRCLDQLSPGAMSPGSN